MVIINFKFQESPFRVIKPNKSNKKGGASHGPRPALSVYYDDLLFFENQ